MPASVSEQIRIFLYSVIGGMLIAFIYDIFRIKRKAVKTRSLFIHIEDFLYWLIVVVVMMGVIYYSNQGEIRGFIFIGALVGVGLYVLLFSRLVIASSMLVIRAVAKALRFIWHVATYPFKILFKFLSIPVKVLGLWIARGFKKVRGMSRNRMAKVALWRKIFKNARKKI